MKSLDLYAKIEPLIGFYDEYEGLYDIYADILKALHVEHILDIGCGNGRFLQKLKHMKYKAAGIDRSQEMVRIATSLGVDARNTELGCMEEEFGCATAVGDVLNYMTKAQLGKFFADLKKNLKKDSYFIADINTLSGFEDVADGLLLKENEKQFLAIEADFQESILKTKITLFEKRGKSYEKFSDTISQYYHSLDFFKDIIGFKLIKNFNTSMFGEDDKSILVFKKL